MERALSGEKARRHWRLDLARVPPSTSTSTTTLRAGLGERLDAEAAPWGAPCHSGCKLRNGSPQPREPTQGARRPSRATCLQHNEDEVQILGARA